MKNKGIIGLIVLIAVILIIVVAFGYNKEPKEMNQNFSNNNININGLGVPIIKRPVINVTPDSYDLETVIYGEVAEHTFVVKNLGNEPLEVLRLSTSCGCTKAIIAEENKVIAPGQSVGMLVTFDPAVHKDNPDLGDVVRIVYIKTNDPENPETEVEITAKVIRNNQ